MSANEHQEFACMPACVYVGEEVGLQPASVLGRKEVFVKCAHT